MLKNGIGVVVPLFNVTLCLLMLHSLRLSRFSNHLLSLVRGRMMIYRSIWFPYTGLSSAPTPIFTTAAPVPVKPPITQVYSWRQNLSVLSQTLVASSSHPVQNDDLLIALHKDKRQCAHPISSFVSFNHLSSSSYSFIASMDSISLSNTVRDALSHLGWHSAMVEEMQALSDNDTWDLVPLPTRKKVIGCRWVFVVKFNPDGYVARLKTRLVAKGYA